MRKFNTMSRKRLASLGLASLAAGALLAPLGTHATPIPYVVTLTQQGGSVVARGSGEVDSSGLVSLGVASVGIAMAPSVGALITGSSDVFGAVTGDLYSLGPELSSFWRFGRGPFTNDASNGTGDVAGLTFTGNPSLGYYDLLVPEGYVSGTALTSGATWDNASFASLGVTPGQYVLAWGSAPDQTFTVDVIAAVPEPAVWGMFGLGLLLIGGFVTLRRRSERTDPAEP